MVDDRPTEKKYNFWERKFSEPIKALIFLGANLVTQAVNNQIKKRKIIPAS